MAQATRIGLVTSGSLLEGLTARLDERYDIERLRVGQFMVVQGRQEVRVNFEMRELLITGVIRPEDITSRNTIGYEKIAEARIAYGGRGQITDVQQPRYGQQIYDVVFPF